MKIALLYFSGTGITAKFARDFAEGFIENQHTVDFFRLKKGTTIDLSSYDIIGLGSPAYSFRIPRLTSKIIRKIDFQNKPIFFFCTSGGMPGNAMWNLYRASKKTAGVCLGRSEGIGITNLRSWMPKKKEGNVNLRGLGEDWVDHAKKYGNEILKRYESWKIKKTKKIRKWLPYLNIQSMIWSWLFTWRWQMALTVGIKRVDKEKCNNCTLCATMICPSGAIKLTDENFPRFNEFKCMGCNGCVNLCPEDAIWSYQTRNRVQYDLYADYILND
jgi:Pyruvate/2-oxoacid:ferredoxin oxidoreductase delta subunit/flavodoxin